MLILYITLIGVFRPHFCYPVAHFYWLTQLKLCSIKYGPNLYKTQATPVIFCHTSWAFMPKFFSLQWASMSLHGSSLATYGFSSWYDLSDFDSWQASSLASQNGLTAQFSYLLHPVDHTTHKLLQHNLSSWPMFSNLHKLSPTIIAFIYTKLTIWIHWATSP